MPQMQFIVERFHDLSAFRGIALLLLRAAAVNLGETEFRPTLVTAFAWT